MMPGAALPSSPEPARIGPNAVVQLGEALLARGERGLACQIYGAGGHPEWLDAPPDAMISEIDVARLHRALARVAPPELAALIASEAGWRTGDYILANRIPKAVRVVLKVLPAPVSARLLTKSIAAHSWTFAGSGVLTHRLGMPLVLEIAGNPLAFATEDEPRCVWHVAVFQRLFQDLVQAQSQVRETACCAAGAATCRFEICWPPHRPGSPEYREIKRPF